MKFKNLIFTSLFSILLFPSISFAEWTFIGKNTGGTSYYVDFNSVRINNQGYIFYWGIANYSKPSRLGHLSSKIIFMLDCNLLRDKIMSDYYYKTPNAKGNPDVSSTEPDKNWDYSAPGTIQEKQSKLVCQFIGK